MLVYPTIGTTYSRVSFCVLDMKNVYDPLVLLEFFKYNF